MESAPVYLDYNATTPVDPQVVEAMLPFFQENHGNPHSTQHQHGKKSADAVEKAREEVSVLIGCSPSEIIFTSGATESINLAIKGLVDVGNNAPDCMVTSSVEHPAVLETCSHLAKMGASLSLLPVLENGLLDWDNIPTIPPAPKGIIAIQYANNETGTIQNSNKINRLAKSTGLTYFSDATQAVGKIELDPKKEGIDLMAFSGHKLYGPKGIGALFINSSSSIPLEPIIHGGRHESGVRAGTLNVPAIVGFGKACSIASNVLHLEKEKTQLLKQTLLDELLNIKGAELNGHPTFTLPNTINVSFQNINAGMLTEAIESQLSLATGSACSSAQNGPSHVLRAMGLTSDRINGAIRISLGRFTTREEVVFAAKTLSDTLAKLRN